MAKKRKKDQDMDDDAFEFYKEAALKTLEGLEPEFVLMVGVYTYLWWKAWGAGNLPKSTDLVMGVMYASTIPNALRGGLVANSYAIAILTALGVGMPGVAEFLEGMGEGVGEAMKQISNGVWPQPVTADPSEPSPKVGDYAVTPQLDDFRRACEAAGGYLVIDFSQGYNVYKCRLNSVDSEFEAWKACKENGGTWDFNTAVCNVPTQGDDN